MATRPAKTNHPLRSTLRLGLQLCALVVIVVALLLAVARMMVPLVGQHADRVYEVLSEQLGRTITAQHTKTAIQRLSPQLALEGVELLDPSGKPAARIGEVFIKFDIIQSVLDRRLRFDHLRVVDPEIVIEQHDGVWRIAGFDLNETIEHPPDARPGSRVFFAWLGLLSGLRLENVRVDCEPCNRAITDRIRLPSLEFYLDRDETLHLNGTVEWRDTSPEPLILRAGFKAFCPANHSQIDLDFSSIYATQAGRSWHSQGNLTVMLDGLSAAEINGSLNYVDVSDLLTVINASINAPALSDFLVHTVPGGSLTEMTIHVPLADESSTLSATAKFADLRLNAWNNIPGVSGISGEANFNGQVVDVALESEQVVFDAPHLFRNTLSLDQLIASLSWQPGDEGWEIRAPKIDASNGDLTLSGSGAFDWYHDTERSPEMALMLSFRDVDGRRTSHYLPAKIMADSLVSWLDHNLIDGQIPVATLTLNGPLRNFPFHRSDGEFKVSATIENGHIVPSRFAHWPAIENIHGELVFDRSSLHITADSATTHGIPIDRVTASVADVLADQSSLMVEGQALVDLKRDIGYINASPLQQYLGAVMDEVSLSGTAKLALDLSIPFDDQETAVDGWLQLNKATVGVINDELLFSDVSGKLRFNGSGLKPSELTARFLGYPTHVTLHSESNSEVLIEADGRFDDKSLNEAFDLPQIPLLKGSSAWVAKVRVGADKTIVQFDSDLRGTALLLPAPLDKAADSVSTLRVKASIRDELAALRIQLDDHQARLELDLTPHVKLNRGHIGIFQTVKALPKSGTLLIDVNTTLNAEPWLSWYQHLPPAADANARHDAIDVLGTFTQIEAAGQRLDNTSVLWSSRRSSVNGENERWSALLSGSHVAGTIRYLEQQPNDRLIVKLDKLYVSMPDEDEASEQTPAPPKTEAPRIFDIDIAVEQLFLDSRNLGTLSLQLTQDEYKDVRVSDLRLTNEDTRLFAELNTIHGDAGVAKSSLTLSVGSDNFGRTLNRFGFENTLVNGRGTAELNSRWPGSISDFAIARISGDFKVKMKEAIVPAIEPGIGRLFGALSLETLTRRLTLDFSDLIEQGFTVDRLEGHGNFELGVMNIEEMNIRGPAADIRLSGDTNLLTKELFLDASVLPKVTSSLPLAAALTNPMLGLAILFAQTALKEDLEKMTQMDYRIRGRWSDPSATEVK